MDRDEYEKAYPARILATAPEEYRYQAISYWDAHNALDKIEVIDECLCEVVVYDGTYYVIYKD